MNKILPSILNVSDLNKFLDRLDDINNRNEIKIKDIHVDIMDGIFVENKCGKLEDIKTINERGYSADVHLMVEKPKDAIDLATSFKADSITIHYEIGNFENIFNYLLEIKNEKNIKIGISICPETDINVLAPYLDKIDKILVMSVHPGKGGQIFINKSYEKISNLRKLSKDVIITVDGGINDTNIIDIIKSGADNVVVGSYITKEEYDMENKINKLQFLI